MEHMVQQEIKQHIWQIWIYNKCTFIEYKLEAGNSDAPVIDLSPDEVRDRFMSEIRK